MQRGFSRRELDGNGFIDLGEADTTFMSMARLSVIVLLEVEALIG